MTLGQEVIPAPLTLAFSSIPVLVDGSRSEKLDQKYAKINVFSLQVKKGVIPNEPRSLRLL